MRTSWVVRTVRRQHGEDDPAPRGEHEKLAFVSDQRGHPTVAADLARMLVLFASDRLPGTWHVTNQGAVSWHEFAEAVLAADGDDPSRVGPITTAELHPPRPGAQARELGTGEHRAGYAGIDLLPDFHESLGSLVAQIRAAT